MIANEDITVVVQGPVQSLPDRDQDEGITHRCLQSVRTHLPGSRLILSTWPDQDLHGLEYDELVVSEDPGPNIVDYSTTGKPGKENQNRQIVSTVAGLRRVETRYAVKLRADNYLTGNHFKELQTQFPKRCDAHRYSRERVVTNNTFARLYAKGMRVAFHSCDFFYFGLTEDVLDMWDLPLFDDFEFDPDKLGQRQYHGFPGYHPDATQDFWLRYLNKHMTKPIEIRHLHDLGKDYLRISDLCYANNLVVAGPNDIGLGLPEKFGGGTKTTRKSRLFAYLQFQDWQLLYRRYCYPVYRIDTTIGDKIKKVFWRDIYMPYRSMGPRWMAAMKRWRYKK